MYYIWWLHVSHILFQEFIAQCLTGLDWDTTPIIHVSSSFTFDMGPLKVRGLVGDITNLTVDAIVNSSNKTLDLRKGQYSTSALYINWSSSAQWTRQIYFNSKQNKRCLSNHTYQYTSAILLFKKLAQQIFTWRLLLSLVLCNDFCERKYTYFIYEY